METAVREHIEALEHDHRERTDALSFCRRGLHALAEATDSLHEELRREAELLACEIACEAVLKLLGKAAADGELIRGLVATALKQCEHARIDRIRVSTGDTASLKAEGVTRFGNLTIVADEHLEPGDCHIESSRGNLDASLRRQLEAFLKTMSASHAGD
jgi:flagellar biosynthesis/type III secretory pathway protein FliH